MTPLRIFVGLQTVVLAIASPLLPQSIVPELHGWLWSVLLGISGTWLACMGVSDRYIGVRWRGLGTRTCRLYVEHTANWRVGSYFYSGSVWAGLLYSAVEAGQVGVVELMAPMFVGLMFLLAFRDAHWKRGKVLARYEIQQSTN